MSHDTTYNGWTNYATWNIFLWIENDAALLDYATECTQATIAQYSEEPSRAEGSLAEQLKDFFTYEENPLADQAGPWQDILTHALLSADWYEIASHLLADHGIEC